MTLNHFFSLPLQLLLMIITVPLSYQKNLEIQKFREPLPIYDSFKNIDFSADINIFCTLESKQKPLKVLK